MHPGEVFDTREAALADMEDWKGIIDDHNQSLATFLFGGRLYVTGPYELDSGQWSWDALPPNIGFPPMVGKGRLARASGVARGIKAANLPAWKKVAIDMAHVAEGHMAGGVRATARRTLFPEYMSRAAIERTIRTAYKFGKRMETQAGRVRVRGEAEGLTVDMWVNTETKIIETAYPVF